jgi:hypothetical protein
LDIRERRSRWIAQPPDALRDAGKLGGAGCTVKVLPQIEEQSL